MKHDLHAARDISFAQSVAAKGGRAVIRIMENATGRIRLIKRAKGYEDEVAAGRDFWSFIVDRYGLSLKALDLFNLRQGKGRRQRDICVFRAFCQKPEHGFWQDALVSLAARSTAFRRPGR